jgi:hypothetical protein
MRFWGREVAGWALVVAGLFVFYLCFAFLSQGRVVETGPAAFIGFIVFRGGIHLLKVALAARVCMQARATIVEQEIGFGARGPALRDPRMDRLRGQMTR